MGNRKCCFLNFSVEITVSDIHAIRLVVQYPVIQEGRSVTVRIVADDQFGRELGKETLIIDIASCFLNICRYKLVNFRVALEQPKSNLLASFIQDENIITVTGVSSGTVSLTTSVTTNTGKTIQSDALSVKF